MSTDTLMTLVGEVERKDELIAELTASLDSYKASYGLIMTENDRLRKQVNTLHDKYVYAARDRQIARTALYKLQAISLDTLQAIQPQPTTAEEPPPRAVVFGR